MAADPEHDAHDARPLLEQLETAYAGEGLVAGLAYLASPAVAVPAEELNAALRRALLVLTAGGDPHRALGPDARAVRSLADDLRAPGRPEALAAALVELRGRADGLPEVASALERLAGDPDLAWRWLACALLAAEVSDGGEDAERRDPSNE